MQFRWPAPDNTTSSQLWHSLHYFNLYRMTVSGVFVVSFVLFGPTLTYGAANPGAFFLFSVFYLGFSLLAEIPVTLRWPRFEGQLFGHMLADVVFVTSLMHTSGGMKSGLGLLLLISMTAAGLVGRGRLVLFFASVSSLAVLSEQSYRVLELQEDSSGFVHSALLSAGLFTTAWLAHMLLKRMLASERVAREKSIDLENLEQVNQLVLQDMDDGVLVVDGESRLRQFNRMGERLLGRSLGRGGEGLLASYSKPLADCLERRKERVMAGFEVFKPDSSGRQLRARFVPVGGDPQHGMVIFLEDMGKIQAQAQQFKLAALGRLTAGVAHEIRNPLSAISYADELLLEEEGLSPTQKRLLEIIRDNTRRLEKMIQEVLQLNRRDRAQKEPINLTEFIGSFVEEFCQIEKVEATVFAIHVAAEMPLACFDRGHLNQILWNLCRNAVRYCRKESASVRVEARTLAHEGYDIELSVADDGPGVDETVRAQLFEPFFTTSSQGTGLGLYVAREICEANDALLEYVSERAGGCFRVLMRGEPC